MHAQKLGRGKRRIIVKSKLKFCIFITVVIVFCVLFISSALNRGNAANNITWIAVDIVEGDTLWGIAKRTLPSRMDIREYIREIREVNNLESCNIKVGQRLYIPVY
jgi:hypothetical protein